MNWYYSLNNQRHGPVSENEFDFLIHQKKIMPGTLVWNESMADWRPLREVQPEAAAPLPLPNIWDVPRPVPPPPPEPERDGPAWEWRDSIGGLKAVKLTITGLLFRTDRTFSRMKRESDWAGPYCFALFVLGTVLFVVLFGEIIATRLVGTAKEGTPLLASNYFAGFFLIALYFAVPVLVVVSVFLNSAFIHMCLMIVGGARQPFQTTYRVVCYSLGASAVFQLIPWIGPIFAVVFNIALLIRGIARMNEISLAKAILAMTPTILLTGLFILTYFG